MKHANLFLSALMFVLIFSSGCSKNNNNNNGGPGTPMGVKYPATIAKTDVSGKVTTTYQYNDKNQLIGYKRSDGIIREIGTAQIGEVVPSLTFTATSLWNFENMNGLNVYEGGSVGRMLWETTYKYFNGNTETFKRGTHIFSSTPDGRMESCLTSSYVVPSPTTTTTFTYDDKKSLKQIDFFQSTDPGRVLNRLKVMGGDDKPSPFSGVRGYQWLSFPQAYAWDYAFSFCLNNPARMVMEALDKASGTYKMTEQHDFTYTYDTDGYPTTITLNTTYYAAVTTRYSATYEITYK